MTKSKLILRISIGVLKVKTVGNAGRDSKQTATKTCAAVEITKSAEISLYRPVFFFRHFVELQQNVPHFTYLF